MSYIGKIKIGSDNAVSVGSTLYGEATWDSTNSRYNANTGNLANVDNPLNGLTVHVKFSSANTHTSPTLKVGSLDAKPIHRVAGTSVGTDAATSWPNGAIVSLTFDNTIGTGGAWVVNSATDVNTTYSITTGDNDGQIKVTPSVGSAYNINVKGLKSAAYTESSAYATSAQGTLADNAMPKSGGTFTGNVDFDSGATLTVNTPTANGHAATKKYVDDALSSAMGTADAMVFCGTLGTGGTITSVPDGSAGHEYKKGATYKIITAGTYAGKTCEVGDLLIAVSDSATNQSAVQNSHWTVAQGNVDSSLYKGSNVLTDGHLLVADGTNGQVKDGGAIASSITTGSTSTNVPTSAAVASFVEGKGYVDSSGVTSVAAGIGLTTADGNAITTTGTIKVKLKSETALGADSAVGTETTNRNYAIVQDHSGYLAVSVPWTDTDTKVVQTGISTNDSYPILLKNAANTTDETNGANYVNTTNKLVTVNPSTGIITAAGFAGTFSGTLQASDVLTALGYDSTASTSTPIFLHKSGTWKTVGLTGTIASVSDGVLTILDSLADSNITLT